MKNSNPLISVILPVYNAQDYLKESIDCILNQSYNNFEFIIINDGSTDHSKKIIQSYSDERIKYIYHDNKGLGATLNIGLEHAKGKYIARQDQDDISHKDRFNKQVDFLEKNSTVLLLGTRARIFKDDSGFEDFHLHAIKPCDLKFDLLFDNPFVHSSTMFRKSTIDAIGGYNSDRNLYEDYDLWSRFSAHGSIANLPEILVDYRVHDKGLSKNFANFKEYALVNQGSKNIETLIGFKNQIIADIEALFHWKKEVYKGSSIKEMNNALDGIANKIKEIYPNEEFAIENRKKQYKKIIRYRLNVLARREVKFNFFKLLYLKAENKLLNLKSSIINI